MSESVHGMWSSRLMFILAVAGSAVGLGNIWRFPYVAGENGGGVFVLAYLACIFLIGIPIMVAEILLGRAGRKSPINTMRDLTARSGAHAGWQIIGWMGALGGFMVLSFYAVIAGLAVAYMVEMASGEFVGVGREGADAAFARFTANAWTLVGWHTLFMLATIFITARGVSRGLETTVRYLMPMLFVLLVLLVLWAALTSGHFMAGLGFLFSFKAEQFSGESVLIAMGQAFFTLSLGMAVIMAYGAYLPKSASIVNSAATIAILDTVVALLAGMAIFPIVFANGLESAEGPGLIFVTLPLAFGQMEAGWILGTLFFLLLTFAAITSAISMIEPAVAWLVERLQVGRAASAAIIGGLAWLVGIGCALSFNVWSDITFLPGMTFFDSMIYVVNNIMLPVGGVLIALFAGWVVNRQIVDEQLAGASARVKSLLNVLIRFVAPVGVLIVFVMTFLR